MESFVLPNRRLSNLNIRHLFNKCDYCGVVQITLSLVHERNQNLLYCARKWQADLHRLGCLQSISKILLMQANSKSWFKIAANHHRSFGIEDGAARQPAFDGVEDD